MIFKVFIDEKKRKSHRRTWSIRPKALGVSGGWFERHLREVYLARDGAVTLPYRPFVGHQRITGWKTPPLLSLTGFSQFQRRRFLFTFFPKILPCNVFLSHQFNPTRRNFNALVDSFRQSSLHSKRVRI